MRMRAVWRPWLFLWPFLAWVLTGTAYGAIDLTRYDLDIRIEPATHGLEVRATVEIPPEEAARPLDFALAGQLRITDSSLDLEELAGSTTDEGFSGINGTSADLARRQGVKRYRVTLPPGTGSFTVSYSGPVDLPPTASAEEYARSFQETPGIIGTEGVYLAGSTLWYPYLGDGLVTYTLRVPAPQGWHLIAPGNGVSAGEDGLARWESPSPVDEISLVGGPLIAYRAPGPVAEAQVFLRKEDGALAEKYLGATSRYLRMYAELIGPYPYTKFALVENFWETGYGMPSYTLLGPQIIRFPFILTSSYPHEILHNWWGNSVYVNYGTGNWAEGLTAYLADHLMKEGEGRGHEYRRDTLKKYRSFVSTSRDFPLTEFRSRHSAATEAVGYGKTLMGFHMLRQKLGDADFRRGLSGFYREFRGKRAGFRDLQASFEEASGQSLQRFFDDLTLRTGAADLVVDNVAVSGAATGYTVTGTLRQRQAQPFAVRVPVVVTTAGEPVIAYVDMDGSTATFSVDTAAEPLLVAVDPEFDVFRVLDPREMAPSIGQLFGAERVLAVIPDSPRAEQESWREAVSFWQGGIQDIEIRTDAEVRELPGDRPVWLLGRANRLARGFFGNGREDLALRIDDSGVTVDGQRVPFAGHSLVLVHRHPADMELAVAWVTGDPPAARDALVRKLPHYGKYSWLGFEGASAENMAKGEWPTGDSPLLVALKPGAPMQAATIPGRQPLAEPPPEFSAERLREHVEWLAAPEREGRGFGTTGLDEAARYIAREFEAAGLEPGGPDGDWFQTWTSTGGDDGRESEVHNVIGVIPGTDPAYEGQAALVTAHYDHLGHGWPNPRAGAEGQLHPGADDNASGVAVLLEMARQFAAGAKPPRTLVFIAFGDEEPGLRGSRHFVANPTVPLEGIVGVVNMDTVGRLGEEPVSVLATESAREWPFVFRGITAVTGIPVKTIAGAAESSDQQSFIEAGIPGVQLFTGAHLDYHKPSDTADKVDAEGLVKVAVVAREAANYLASTERRPTPANAGGPPPPGGPEPGGEGRRVSFGAIPDFAFQGEGLRLDGVVPESPAAAAGLRAGDVVTSLGGGPVTSLGSFNERMKVHSPGDQVEVTWQRDGEEHRATVELKAR